MPQTAMRIALVLLVMPLLACNFLYAVPNDGSVEPPPTIMTFAGPDFEAVVFSAEASEANNFGDYTVFPNPTDYWTPTEADILALEANLEPFLAENAELFRREPPIETWLPDYARQYYGFVRDGEQFIYGNFLCARDLLLDHPEDIVIVMDGGDCFFQLIYQPTTQAFSNLMVNGDA